MKKENKNSTIIFRAETPLKQESLVNAKRLFPNDIKCLSKYTRLALEMLNKNNSNVD
jgi:hypothetical protein